jgi:hypothetical protein
MRKTRVGSRIDEEHCVWIERNKPADEQKVSFIASRGELGEYIIDMKCLLKLTKAEPDFAFSMGCAVRMAACDISDFTKFSPHFTPITAYFPALNVSINKDQAESGEPQFKFPVSYRINGGPIFGFEKINVKTDAGDWHRMRLISDRCELFSMFTISSCMIGKGCSDSGVVVSLGARAKFNGTVSFSTRHGGKVASYDEGVGVFYSATRKTPGPMTDMAHSGPFDLETINATYISQDNYKAPGDFSSQQKGPLGRKSLYAAVAAPCECSIR